MNGQIFISYNWTEPSGSIVNNWLIPSIKSRGINYLVDKENCGYNDDIDKFEAEIPKSSKVILVLQSAFFESMDCMFEAALAVSKCDLDKQVYVINLSNYNFRKDEAGLYKRVLSNFTAQKLECEEAISKLSGSTRIPYNENLRKLNTIIENLGKLWKMLGSKNYCSFEKVSRDNFMIVCDELKTSLENGVLENVTNEIIEPLYKR